ncbi:GspH/FimT family pseudopilin [Rugamonas sp.]|uniref:GspH/FimT family pseudopilin n=1 Tax=Rugamonas sp. TaxID=1926287 RepID=UPI0025D0F9D7|nr:GspH/FimT family pseudopilin [Rugamonas sp.]
MTRARTMAAGAAAAAGTTLVELLCALLIGAVLLGAALPTYQALLQGQRLRSAVADLFAAIDLTRSEALARGATILLAPLDPAGSAWEQGWQVFADRNGNRRRDAGEELIYQHGPVADGITIHAAFSSGTPSGYLAYNGAGRSCAADNPLAARFGTLSLTQGAAARNIKINMLGRVRVCDPQVQTSGCTGLADP